MFVNAAATASTTDPAQIIYINGASIGDITVADTSVSSGYSKHDLYKGFVTGTEVEENVYAAVAEGTGVASGFYVISKKDANGAYILDSTTNYTADTGAYAVDGGNVASVGNDRYVTINGSTYDVGSALIVDTRELPANVSAVNSVAELSDLLGSNNVVAYVMFNADTNVAEYLYIDAVQAGGGLVSVNEPANSGAYGNLVSGDVAVVDDGFTTSQVSGMADNVKCLVFVFADANNGNSSKEYTLKISEAGKTDGAIYTDSGNINDTNEHQFYLAIDGGAYNEGSGTMAGSGKILPAGSYYFTITQGTTVIESGYFEYAG